MTLAELKTMTERLGVPAVYGYFPEEQSPDYIAYMAETANTIHADGIVVFMQANITMTLVTERRNPALEQRIMDELTAMDVDFGEPDYEFDEKQHIHKATFYFQTID